MFLEVPVLLWDEEKDDDVEVTMYINPMHVISIEPINRANCYAVMTGEIYYQIPISRKKLKILIEDFIKENILSKLYKDIKDQEGKN